MQSYTLKKHLTRKITFYKADDTAVPKELFTAECEAPDLNGFPYPLPSKKSDYTCYSQGNNGVLWFAGKTGITRYDKNAENPEDVIMYFSACRHIPTNSVDRILSDGDDLWALAGNMVSHIEMVSITCKEKAAILLDETQKYVQRRGMVSQRDMSVPGDITSVYPYASCDNDGLFTSNYALGELMHYATLRRELGENNPETLKARADATLASEACLMLMYIHGRPEGFISRSYHVGDEPVPDDGMFYKRSGNFATAIETTDSINKGRAGEKFRCDYPIPERLRHLLTDYGYTEDDVTYKADTSSDEICGHFLQMRFAHDFLGPDDPELDAIIKDAVSRTMKHIIDGNFEFLESNGNPTTWAKWSRRYFFTDPNGYTDGPLNSAELLMYLKVTMHITGEAGIWQETYDKLIEEGYADMTLLHREKVFQGAIRENVAVEEDFMYGDNMLCLISYWMLCGLEKDEKLADIYRRGFKSWKHILLREHNPAYDFPFILSCPDADIDISRDISWFRRFELSRVIASVNVGSRHDIPKKRSRTGKECEYFDNSALIPMDENVITKYDRNPFQYIEYSEREGFCVESCYVFTFAYWLGRYYGIIKEEDGNE